MRALRILSCVLAAAACVHRVPANAGPDVTAQSGVPVAFGDPRVVLPAGAVETWDFGDGHKAEGVTVTHAFPRAGEFNVAVTLRDADGQERRSASHVVVLRRAPAAALPRSVATAILVDRPWARVAGYRRLADRFGLGPVLEAVVSSLRDNMGFDALDAAEVRARGFDPDEGVALATVPGEPDAFLMAVGVEDDALAEASLRKALSLHEDERRKIAYDERALAGVRVVVASLEGYPPLAYAFRYGYLYLRPGVPAEGGGVLAAALSQAADAGLEGDADFKRATAKVGPPGDVTLFVSRAGLTEPGEGGEVGPIAATLAAGEDAAAAHAFAFLSAAGDLREVLTAAPASAPLARRLPRGAHAFARLAVSFPAVAKHLHHAIAAKEQGDLGGGDALAALFGVDLEKEVLPTLTGNVAIAYYAAPRAPLSKREEDDDDEEDDDERTLLGRGTALAVLEAKDAPALEKALAKAAAHGGVVGLAARKTKAGVRYEASIGPSLTVALQVKDGVLFVAAGPDPEALSRAVATEPADALAPALDAALAGVDTSAAELGYVDLAGLVDLVGRDAASRELAEWLHPLRDLVIATGVAGQEGLDARATLRLRAPVRK